VWRVRRLNLIPFVEYVLGSASGEDPQHSQDNPLRTFAVSERDWDQVPTLVLRTHLRVLAGLGEY
jgi:hypothetical protein